MKILVSIAKKGAWSLFFPQDVVERLKSLGDVIWNESENEFSDEELKAGLKDADICFTGWGTGILGKEILENAGRLKIVAHVGASITPIVSDYLYEKGIKVISGNFVHAESVAEGVVGYILCSLRHMPYFASEMQKGQWKVPYNVMTEGLLDQTVGLVGFGAIARRLAVLLRPFRTNIMAFDPFVDEKTFKEYGVRPVSLEEIFSYAGIISIHASSKPDTYHMINKKLIGKIQDGALLVNTARGDLIDEEALVTELKKKRFKAVLDVYTREPLPSDSKLIGLDNVILMPHAAVSLDRYKHVTRALIEDIVNYYDGRALKNEISSGYAINMTRM